MLSVTAMPIWSRSERGILLYVAPVSTNASMERHTWEPLVPLSEVSSRVTRNVPTSLGYRNDRPADEAAEDGKVVGAEYSEEHQGGGIGQSPYRDGRP